jgi:hypothetical protein
MCVFLGQVGEARAKDFFVGLELGGGRTGALEKVGEEAVGVMEGVVLSGEKVAGVLHVWEDTGKTMVFIIRGKGGPVVAGVLVETVMVGVEVSSELGVVGGPPLRGGEGAVRWFRGCDGRDGEVWTGKSGQEYHVVMIPVMVGGGCVGERGWVGVQVEVQSAAADETTYACVVGKGCGEVMVWRQEGRWGSVAEIVEGTVGKVMGGENGRKVRAEVGGGLPLLVFRAVGEVEVTAKDVRSVGAEGGLQVLEEDFALLWTVGAVARGDSDGAEGDGDQSVVGIREVGQWLSEVR